MAKFAYWSMRGYAQPIRYLMQYAGESYEEKIFIQKGPPDFDKSSWRDVKDTLGLDFPNLPYYIDEKAGVKISQSKAILLYLARKHNLVKRINTYSGTSRIVIINSFSGRLYIRGSEIEPMLRVVVATKPDEMIRQDVVFFESIDLHNSFFFLTYQPSFVEMRDDYVTKDLPHKLKLFEDFIQDRKFFVSDKPNYADFNVYEAIFVHTVLAPDCLKEFPKLKAFMKRFENLKGIKEYMQSKDYFTDPICSRAAFFSAGNEEETDDKTSKEEAKDKK